MEQGSGCYRLAYIHKPQVRGQGYASMSTPTKELEKRLLGNEIAHGGNPVLRWMASNVAAEQDAAGNIKPSKAKSTERIDGVVAAIMSLGQVIANEEPRASTYENGESRSSER